MKKVKRVPLIDSLSGGKDHLKEWSSGPQLCIQHFSGHFIGMEPLAKPEFSKRCPGVGTLPNRDCESFFTADSDKSRAGGHGVKPHGGHAAIRG
jgi:hypothetical protein